MGVKTAGAIPPAAQPGAKKRELHPFVKAAADAYGFKEPMLPDAVPNNKDWHTVIISLKYDIQGSRGFHEFRRFVTTVAHWNGEGWTDGNSKSLLDIFAWDRQTRIINDIDAPMRSDKEVVTLIETVLHQYRLAYLSVYREFKKNPSKENRQKLRVIENEFPVQFLPSITKEEAIRNLRNSVDLDEYEL